MEIFGEFFTSSVNIALTVIFFITASINTFDKRLIQAKRGNQAVPTYDGPLLPNWVIIIHIIYYGSLFVLLFIDWKVAIAFILIKFVLDVLPVMETIGNVLMSPFKQKK